MQNHVVELGPDALSPSRGTIHYADWGGSGSTMVLVHGLGGSLANWMAVAPALSGEARVLALDLPGFGRTPPDGRALSVEGQVATVVSFLDRVAGGPCILVGNSMGGMISAALAALHPARFSRLVLVDPALPTVLEVLPDPVVTATMLAYMTPGVGRFVMRARRSWPPRRYVASLLDLCSVDAARVAPEIMDAMIELVEYRRTKDWAEPAFIEAARSVGRWTALRPGRYRAILQSVRCPTLLLHGSRDRLVPVGLARAAARLCPRWDLRILDGVGHVPQLEVPERFVEIVTRWLGRAPAP